VRGLRVAIPRDGNPEHWTLGVFYYNPDQPRLVVAKRFGGPFALNFARPVAWVVASVFPVLAVAGLIAHLFGSGISN
jgi:uncharacterized membrane protein